MRKQYIIPAIAVALTTLGSCKKSFFDINHDPNNATNASAELVLPNALTATAAPQVLSYVAVQGWMSYWAPSGSYAINSSDAASYKITAGTGDFTVWQPGYDNLEDYENIETQATAENKPFYVATAKIMKALVFQQLVDNFGNVPYTDALKSTNVILPKYDKADAIYDSIVDQINRAIPLLQRADAIAAANSDVMFDGDAAKWIQFANTLKLRILVRESQVSGKESYIKAELAKTIGNGGGFLTEDAGVNPGYAANAGQQNPVYGYFVTLTGLPTSGGQADYWRAAQYSISFMQANGDNRLTRIYSPGSDGTYKGNTLGSSSNLTGTASSSMGPGILKSVDQPAILISAAESYFLQAEANLRGWFGTAADVTSNYNAGVEADFAFLGASGAEAYHDKPGNKNTNIVACTTFNEKLACIIRQKWMAMNGVTPLEAWDDYRRLHLPADIPLSQSPYSQGHIPTRLIYPNSEYQTNSANVNAEGTIDPQTSKIFWMP